MPRHFRCVMTSTSRHAQLFAMDHPRGNPEHSQRIFDGVGHPGRTADVDFAVENVPHQSTQRRGLKRVVSELPVWFQRLHEQH